MKLKKVSSIELNLYRAQRVSKVKKGTLQERI